MTPAEHERKIGKLHRIRIELSAEARNIELLLAERAALAKAADALADAIRVMEARR
jgi:hypothetical protein